MPEEITYNPSARALADAAMGTSSALAARAKILPTQETRDIERYNIERVKAAVAARIEQKQREDKANKSDSEILPLQVIRNARGQVIMQGHAATVEELIANKMQEAATTTDPKKKEINLMGAQLDEKALGRRLQLDGLAFNNVNMRGINLGGGSITNCSFENTDMADAQFKKTQFAQCAFDTVNMGRFKGDVHTKFSHCALEKVYMGHADAPGMTFEHIHADRMDISEAHFEGSSWTHIHINDLKARNTYMDGSKLGDFHITGRNSNIDGIKHNGASVYNASFGTPDYGISMRGLQARNSSWHNVEFYQSDLTDADFTTLVVLAQMPILRNVTGGPVAPQPNAKRSGA